MRKIGEISKLIESEAEGACVYAKLSMWLRENGYGNQASAVLEMAKQEAAHADRLHEVVVEMVRRQRESGAEVPKGMMDVWECLHSQIVDDLAHARELIAQAGR